MHKMLLADSREPKALPDRLDRQASDRQDEVGHGVQRSPHCLRRLHEPPAFQHRGVDRRRVPRKHW